KHCWVCFATEQDDMDEFYQSGSKYYLHQWVQPCRCKGTTKWVHQACLQRWIDEKQKGNQSQAVSCPQCKFQYVILLPKSGPVIYILEQIDKIIFKICPFIAAGIIVGTVYWTAVTYGAVTVMQVVGHKEGLQLLESADPMLLLLGLPAIPIILILSKMIRWEDQVLQLWRKHTPKLDYIYNKILFPVSSDQSIINSSERMNDFDHFANDHQIQNNYVYDIPPTNSSDSNSETNLQQNGNGLNHLTYDHVSATRVLCGAMILPTLASIVGRFIAPNLKSHLQRTLLGGLVFLTCKGALKLYYRQTQYTRLTHRNIMDHRLSTSVSPLIEYPIPDLISPTGSRDRDHSNSDNDININSTSLATSVPPSSIFRQIFD
ncbi:unnamed protein product, partial [Gordionus sp. m RMFG-2023]